MPTSIAHVSQTDTFNTWRVRTNQIIDWLNGPGTTNIHVGLVPPTVTDDLAAGFQVGSVWIDNGSTPNEVYRCTDNTNGAAVWLNTTLEIGDLGSIVTQNANAVNITGGSISGITDLAIADGGTGASDAPTARTNLGVYSKSEVDALVSDNAIALVIALGG